MRKPVKSAALLVGLGVGAAFGPSLGSAAVWSGVAIAAIGVALSLIGTPESDLVRDGGVDDREDSGMPGNGTTAGSAVVERRPRDQQRSNFSDLGPRVAQIFRLAEEQADNLLTEARLEAERVVTAARREADAHLNRAREQAAGITGTHQNVSPIPPTRAPSPDEGPSPHV